MRSLITGITGQDGSYLADLLLARGDQVHGIVRSTVNQSYKNIAHIEKDLILHTGDMTDGTSIHSAIQKSKPDEIYYMAAMNQVGWSYDVPHLTMETNCGGLLRVIESVRSLNLDPRIYFASSSETYGRALETPQTELTPFNPRSPYGVSKTAGVYTAKVFRETHNLKISCGILYNHESPRRGEHFLSKKVCKYVASVSKGNKEPLKLGSLESRRDFGYAPEYMEWVIKILQYPPDDFVIATGETHSIRDFLDAAFTYIGISDWTPYITQDQTLLRPTEVDKLVGDCTKARTILGFKPIVKFKELVQLMMNYELK